MRRLAIVVCAFVSHGVSSATDFIIPDPVTYEWTVKWIQREIPLVEWKGVSIREAIGSLGSSMDSPIRLEHDLPDDVLEKRLDVKLTKVSRMALVAKIADVADADIIIGKGEVRLKRRVAAEKAMK